MTHFDPIYAVWKTYDAFQLWELAMLMLGVEPMLRDDYVVRDPNDPKGKAGVPLDISHEVDLLHRALVSGALNGRVAPVVERSDVFKQNLLPWLRSRGYAQLADSLDPGVVAATPAAVVPVLEQNKQAILHELRRLGYDPKRLPPPDGLAGAKKKVRDSLSTQRRIVSKSGFDKAWIALHKDCLIAFAN